MSGGGVFGFETPKIDGQPACERRRQGHLQIKFPQNWN